MGRPSDIRAELAAALSALDDEVAAGLRGWKPPPWLWQDTDRDVCAALEHTRLCLALTSPSDRNLAVRDLWPVFLYMLWCEESLGTLDFETVFVLRNINAWLNEMGDQRKPGWKQRARSVLRRIGRVVNPSGWPPDHAIGARPVAAAYTDSEEAAFKLAVGLPGRLNPVPGQALVALSLGGGLRGSEAALVRPDDILELPDGRLAVQVSGPHPRLVPIRGGYTDLLRSASALTSPEDLFIPGRSSGAPYTVAQLIKVKGLGKFSLNRARSTWVTAHLLAGTPLPYLRIIAGPLSGDTLSDLINAAALAIDPDEAVERGLKA